VLTVRAALPWVGRAKERRKNRERRRGGGLGENLIQR
jgi:hypothetical protein